MSSDPARGATAATFTVATVLTPAERSRVDAAGAGLYAAHHHESIDDLLRALRERPVAAVLVSATRCDSVTTTRLSRMVREFPRIPAVALLSQFETQSARAVLALGGCGVQQLVDVRQPGGWHQLRAVLAPDHAYEIRRVAIDAILSDLPDAPGGCQRFFAALFSCGDDVSTVRQLARLLGVLPSTMTSRFFRASLPAPKRYLAFARLVRAARVLENGGVSVARCANELEYSSPQSFCRHVRALLGMSTVEFRRGYTGEAMLRRFRDELVLPHRDTLRRFEPLG
ncbi:MAG TPA: helix-turn-helix domain-containing protein [Gemmatimonadaceae bacterium]|jgi:AraC-like DNA-binding protein